MKKSSLRVLFFEGIIYALLCISVVLFSFSAGYALHAKLSPRSEQTFGDDFALFWQAWDLVDTYFYTTTLPSPREITYGAIHGSLQTLQDPYTVLVEPEPNRLEQDDLRGSFGGIGAWVMQREDGSIVLQPMPGQPAEQAGLQDGDILIAVDGKSVEGLSLQDVLLMVRGPIGEPVELTVRREGVAEPITITVVRAEIVTPSLSWRLLEEDPTIGYIQLRIFSERTPGELEDALTQLKQQGATHLILDLRDNGGGLLDSAIDVASQFIDEGVIVYEKHRDSEQVYRARRGGVATEIPLVVLVNGGTASAAEIVAGAIQDTGRGILVGEQTFGKGSVQFIFSMEDGSSLHVTTALWLTPNRRVIHGHGLTPDFVVHPAEDGQTDVQLAEAVAQLNALGQDQ